MRLVILALLLSPLVATFIRAADIPKVSSPDGKLSVNVQSTNGLTYSIDLDGAPLTLGLLGPADVTPGAFLNVREDVFVPNSIPATSPGTRARQLALAVLMDSPFLCLADDPVNYRGQPGIGFYRNLPTTWDETRAVSSEIMQHLVQVRRKGKGWWIAGMNHQQPLELDLKLDFLGEGTYSLTTYADTPESAQRPTSLAQTTREVKRGDTLRIRMENSGGFAATLLPKSRP